MRGALQTENVQRLGVLREFEKAIRSGANALATSIREANADLREEFDRLEGNSVPSV